jgi:hypothetical protein
VRVSLPYDRYRGDEPAADRPFASNGKATLTMAKGEEKKAQNNKAKLSVKEKKAKKKEKLAKKG